MDLSVVKDNAIQLRILQRRSKRNLYPSEKWVKYLYPYHLISSSKHQLECVHIFFYICTARGDPCFVTDPFLSRAFYSPLLLSFVYRYQVIASPTHSQKKKKNTTQMCHHYHPWLK